MKLHEFLNKYNGKKVDFDKVWGAQCVDLFRQYCHDVLEIPHTGGVDSAKDLWLKYKSLPLEMKHFQQIKSSNEIKYGDVVIWGETEKNIHGHVAIAINEFPESILVFEQNGFTQDGAKLMMRPKVNVLGILRSK